MAAPNEQLARGVFERGFGGDVFGKIDSHIRLAVGGEQLAAFGVDHLDFRASAAGDEIAAPSRRFAERLAGKMHVRFLPRFFGVDHLEAKLSKHQFHFRFDRGIKHRPADVPLGDGDLYARELAPGRRGAQPRDSLRGFLDFRDERRGLLADDRDHFSGQLGNRFVERCEVVESRGLAEDAARFRADDFHHQIVFRLDACEQSARGAGLAFSQTQTVGVRQRRRAAFIKKRTCTSQRRLEARAFADDDEFAAALARRGEERGELREKIGRMGDELSHAGGPPRFWVFRGRGEPHLHAGGVTNVGNV